MNTVEDCARDLSNFIDNGMGIIEGDLDQIDFRVENFENISLERDIIKFICDDNTTKRFDKIFIFSWYKKVMKGQEITSFHKLFADKDSYLELQFPIRIFIDFKDRKIRTKSEYSNINLHTNKLVELSRDIQIVFTSLESFNN